MEMGDGSEGARWWLWQSYQIWVPYLSWELVLGPSPSEVSVSGTWFGENKRRRGGRKVPADHGQMDICELEFCWYGCPRLHGPTDSGF